MNVKQQAISLIRQKLESEKVNVPDQIEIFYDHKTKKFKNIDESFTKSLQFSMFKTFFISKMERELKQRDQTLTGILFHIDLKNEDVKIVIAYFNDDNGIQGDFIYKF